MKEKYQVFYKNEHSDGEWTCDEPWGFNTLDEAMDKLEEMQRDDALDVELRNTEYCVARVSYQIERTSSVQDYILSMQDMEDAYGF